MWIKAGNNAFWQKVVIKQFTKQRPKGGKKTVGGEDWGQGWYRSSCRHKVPPFTASNCLTVMGIWQNSVPPLLSLAKSPTSAYTRLQGVAELAELGMGTEKRSIYRI